MDNFVSNNENTNVWQFSLFFSIGKRGYWWQYVNILALSEVFQSYDLAILFQYPTTDKGIISREARAILIWK